MDFFNLSLITGYVVHLQIPDNINVLDLALKFCVQNKSAEKPKPPPIFSPTHTTLPRGPGIASVSWRLTIQ